MQLCCWSTTHTKASVNHKGDYPWVFTGKDWRWSYCSNTLATWCEGADSLEKILMLGNTEGRRRRGWQKMRWLDGITDSMFEQAQRDNELADGFSVPLTVSGAPTGSMPAVHHVQFLLVMSLQESLDLGGSWESPMGPLFSLGLTHGLPSRTSPESWPGLNSVF